MTAHTHASPLLAQLDGHGHPIAEVTGLQAALDDKSAVGHTHPGGSASWGGIGGTLANQTDLQSALDAKAASVHSHDYAATNHNHDAVYEPKNLNIQAHVSQTHAPADAQKNSDITKAEIEAKLIGEITSHTHPANGADPWTYLRLTGDFSTSSATAVDVTGLGFTPAANQRYEFEAQLMLRTATATVNPRAGLAWPTGMTDGVANIDEAQSATTILMARGNIGAALLIAVGGVPNNTQSWPCTVWGMALAGATPSGNIRIQMASETAGTTVTVKAGSYLKYRTIP